MNDIFLVEIRLARTKWRISEMIFGISDSFQVKRHMERHPHITLFGPLILNEEYRSPDAARSGRTRGAAIPPRPVHNRWV